MANSTVTVGFTRDTVAGNLYIVLGTVNFSAAPDTYVTGGNTCSFAIPRIKATRVPFFVQFQEASGYYYVYVPGTTSANGTIRVYVQGTGAQAPAGELTGGAAIPAGVSGDSIRFMAMFDPLK